MFGGDIQLFIVIGSVMESLQVGRNRKSTYFYLAAAIGGSWAKERAWRSFWLLILAFILINVTTVSSRSFF